jgi:hypothetical protein
MIDVLQIPEPILFNPLKHYLPFIREFTNLKSETENYPGSKEFLKELRHLGTCVMDIYKGDLTQVNVFREITEFLNSNGLSGRAAYRKWAGVSFTSHRIIHLSDGAHWTLKYSDKGTRFIHIFPARYSQHTFRIKANTLKSAILYQVLIGKDFISEDDLNKVRALMGLSPIKEIADVEAITEMIEMLRA